MRSEYVQLTLVSQNLSLHTALNTSVTFVNQKLVIIVFSNKLLFFFFWQKHKLNKNWCMRTKTILALLPTNANKMKIFWRDGIQSELKLMSLRADFLYSATVTVHFFSTVRRLLCYEVNHDHKNIILILAKVKSARYNYIITKIHDYF